MSERNALAAELKALSDGIGSLLTPAMAEQLIIYGELLLAWAKVINLTGAGSLEELGRRHFIDAMAVSTFLAEGAAIIDVGSGAGLPAIPLAILRPDLAVTMLEPTAKRVAFLRTAVRTCGLGGRVEVVTGRLGNGEAVSEGTWDAAMARAVWSPTEWAEKGRVLVRPGGQLFVFCVAREEFAAVSAEVRWLGYARDRWLAVVRV